MQLLIDSTKFQALITVMFILLLSTNSTPDNAMKQKGSSKFCRCFALFFLVEYQWIALMNSCLTEILFFLLTYMSFFDVFKFY